MKIYVNYDKDPDDGVSENLWNVDKRRTYYTALQRRTHRREKSPNPTKIKINYLW